jgi:hypothetical protein
VPLHPNGNRDSAPEGPLVPRLPPTLTAVLFDALPWPPIFIAGLLMPLVSLGVLKSLTLRVVMDEAPMTEILRDGASLEIFRWLGCFRATAPAPVLSGTMANILSGMRSSGMSTSEAGPRPSLRELMVGCFVDAPHIVGILARYPCLQRVVLPNMEKLYPDRHVAVAETLLAQGFTPAVRSKYQYGRFFSSMEVHVWIRTVFST